MEMGGVQFAQSLALLVYAGKLAHLYPFDPLVAAEVCLLMGVVVVSAMLQECVHVARETVENGVMTGSPGAGATASSLLALHP
jgi:hypothetical protein